MAKICLKFAIGNGKHNTLLMKAITVLVFNCGSSSLKFGFYLIESSFFDDSTNNKSQSESTLDQAPLPETFQLKVLLNGEIELATKGASQFNVRDLEKELLSERIDIANLTEAATHIVLYIAGFRTPKPEVIAHRIVHGGPDFLQHCFITDKVMRQLEDAAAYAPLHHQAAFDVIKYIRTIFSGLPQVACFDTAFHSNMPDIAKQLPIDKTLLQAGMHRYGFHGLSCESIVHQLEDKMPQKLIIAHLGSGCSITAVKNGQSVDTSMGLTPSGGVMMGTRCGDIDPGILLYLLRYKNYSLEELDHLINHQSGLLGVSGLSSDIRVLHQLATTNSNAKLAIDLFCSTVAKQIAAMMTVLNGLDALIFTGGIGENDDFVRATICKKLVFFNMHIDVNKNKSVNVMKGLNFISAHKSVAKIIVCSSKENQKMALITFRLMSA